MLMLKVVWIKQAAEKQAFDDFYAIAEESNSQVIQVKYHNNKRQVLVV